MSVLTKTDWNKEWALAIGGPRVADTAAFWNAKAARCKKSGQFSPYSNDPYLKTFLEYMAIQTGESVLDIGCGPGSLAVPLAASGHKVCAVDFSQKMLAMLFHESHAAGGLDIIPILADWRDNWDMKGIDKADLAIASRSIAVDDLEAAIRKINSWAKRRACISTSACGSPWFDRKLVKTLGRHVCKHSNFAYCMNILFAMDVRPELRFIDSPKDESWPTHKAAVTAMLKTVAPLTPKEELRFDDYLSQHLVRVTDKTGAKVWKRDYIRAVEWAFIAWDKVE
jgi:SAM-dependent methyltransferase